MKPLIFLALLLTTSPVWACNDFDDCMSNEKLKRVGDVIFHEVRDRPNYLKAICFKLDEISKKLSEKK